MAIAMHTLRQPTRQRFAVQLPEANAFNGSLLPLGEPGEPGEPGEAGRRFLLIYRSSADRLAACHLDGDYRLVPGTHADLNINRNVDARFVRTDAATFMSTSYWDGGDLGSERMELWVLARFAPRPAVGPRLAFKNGYRGDPSYHPCREKNWGPFVQGGEVYYVHQVLPHRILRVDFAAGCATIACETHWPCPHWREEWGREFRGSTAPARLEDGSFLSTFHTVGPAGYYTGFYRFAGEAPFRVLEVSAAPVLTPADATGDKPRCVFPLSLQVEGDLVRVAGGNDDRAVAVYHLSLAEVKQGLVALPGRIGEDQCAALAEAVSRAQAGVPRTDRQILGDALQERDARVEWLDRNCTYTWHYAAGQVLKPRRIGEIGVRFGYSLKSLALGAAAATGAAPEVWGWDGELDGVASNEVAASVLKPVTSWTRVRKVNTADLRTLEVEGLDLFHVDGDHSEGGAVRDLELAWAALRAGGVLLVDDCDHIFPVRRAVEAFCLRRGLAPSYLPTFRGTAMVVKPEPGPTA